MSDGRVLLHSRDIICRGYLRNDGLWDVEAFLTDTKTYDLELIDREDNLLKKGEPLHAMGLRITVDLDLNILNACAVMDHTPFNYCKSVSAVYSNLIGKQITGGFLKETRKLFFATNGCTHLTELIGPLSTTAYQTIQQARKEREDDRKDSNQAPPALNTCHGLSEVGPVAEHYWPDFYKG